MRAKTLRAAGFAAAATVLLFNGGAAAASAAPEPATVRILGINDFHGRLEPTGQDAQGRPIGGAAQLAGMVGQLSAEHPDTLLVSGGDNIGATPFISAVQRDEPTIEALNATGLDVSTVGNHEFDRGFADLTGRVQDLAKFPYLGANVYRGDSPALPESHLTRANGVDVGFVGVVTQETSTLVSPDGIAGLTFRDPTTEANRVAADLRRASAEVVVLLIHEGADTGEGATACGRVADPATVFGRIVNGASADIDAIVSGHSHRAYNCAYQVPGLAHMRPVVQTGNYGSALAALDLTVTGGRVTAADSRLLPVVGYPEDPDVAAIVAEAKAASEEAGSVEVGRITAPIARAYLPGGEDDRGTESVLGNFIADVQLDGTRAPGRGGARIAFMNPGGLRADFAAGVVRYADAAAVQPFANDVVTQTLTGAQIKAVLEQQWQPAGSSRPFLHLGVSKGFRYVYDPDGAAGDRVVAGSITLDGQPVTATGRYRVTTNSFLAAGGDNFTAFAEGTERSSTGDNDLTMLVAYLRARSPLAADTTERALTVDQVPSPSPSPVPTTPAPGSGGGELPVTGPGVVGLAIAGAATLACGVGALVLARRRVRFTAR